MEQSPNHGVFEEIVEGLGVEYDDGGVPNVFSIGPQNPNYGAIGRVPDMHVVYIEENNTETPPINTQLSTASGSDGRRRFPNVYYED